MHHVPASPGEPALFTTCLFYLLHMHRVVRQEQILLSDTWYGADSERNSVPLPDTSV